MRTALMLALAIVLAGCAPQRIRVIWRDCVITGRSEDGKSATCECTDPTTVETVDAKTGEVRRIVQCAPPPQAKGPLPLSLLDIAE